MVGFNALHCDSPATQKTMTAYGQKAGLCVRGEQMALWRSAEMATTMKMELLMENHLKGCSR